MAGKQCQPGPEARVSDEVPEEFTAGSVIAGYRLEQRIGHGGMAVVFRAYDSRLDRQVALKILAPALARDVAFRRRFIRESRAAAAVDHPHIIPVFDAGQSAGVLFIAMRYVRGGDVHSLIERIGPLPVAQVAELVSQVASALDAAHARGLVHRDVKPANMLLDASPAAGRRDHVYLTDFGLSKAAATNVTASGEFLGTLDYVAPEQIEGRRQLDGRSDLYALACSVFEMLAGEPPFRREQGVSVMYAHLSEPPPSLRERRPDLPAAVDDVLSRALAKTPDERYLTCDDFAAALRPALGLAPGRADSGAASQPVSQTAEPAARAPEVHSREPAEPQTDQLTRRGLPGDDVTGDDVAVGPGATGDMRPAQPRQPWRRRPALAAGLCVIALAAAGGGYALAGHGHADHAGQTTTTSAVLTVPRCTSATARGPNLTGVKLRSVSVAGRPFGVVAAPGGNYSFVTLDNSVAVLNTRTALDPTVVQTIRAPGVGTGAALTPDGAYLVAAEGSGADVIDVARAEDGAPDPILGTLTSPRASGAIEVYVDDGYVFVTMENSAELAVFNLQAALAHGFSARDFIGFVRLPARPVGMTSDGKYLYVASLSGKLTTVSLAEAESHPARAVVSSVVAGCGAARALISADHRVVWVTDRNADALLAFSAAKLRTDPEHALIARVMVGASPVGETFVKGGTRIVVADAALGDRTYSTVAVVSTADALTGKKALLGYLTVGSQARQFAVVPGGKTLLLTLQGAHVLETIDIPTLP
jgi:DNA-binding beta-propeller fold protein YncE